MTEQMPGFLQEDDEPLFDDVDFNEEDFDDEDDENNEEIEEEPRTFNPRTVVFTATRPRVFNLGDINPWGEIQQQETLAERLERERREMRERMENQKYSYYLNNYLQERENGKLKAKLGRKRKVGLAYNAFTSSFRELIPDIKVISSLEDVRKFDLIIFSGGGDVDPRLYGQYNSQSFGINRHRDDFETAVFEKAVGKRKILGVCRGHQLINALTGGNLDQDYYINSDQKIWHDSQHLLEFREGINNDNSVVYKFFNNRTVISAHHQSVQNTGRDLVWTSKHKGIIESTETNDIITVQFHPEFDSGKSYVQAFFKYLLEEW